MRIAYAENGIAGDCAVMEARVMLGVLSGGSLWVSQRPGVLSSNGGRLRQHSVVSGLPLVARPLQVFVAL